MSRSHVQNAADHREVESSRKMEKRREDRWKQSLTAVMDTPHGRAVLWRLLGLAGIFRSVFNAHGGQMAYNAGRQDLGHELQGLISDLGPEAWLVMEREGREAEQLDEFEIAEQHRQRARDRRDGREEQPE